MMCLKCIHFILYFVLLLCCVYCLSCKDEDGKPVDWFVIYKIPKEKKSVNPLINNGVGYIFITSKTIGTGWTLSNISINSTESIPGLTLHPYYNNDTSLHILYNDQPPSGTADDNFGHTKGVIISNSTLGFWLIHSVPHYPTENSYTYPDTGLRYGQSFLCLSTNMKYLNDIGIQLQYNNPFIYKSFIKNELKLKIPNINNVLRNIIIKNAPWYNVQPIITMGNQQFLSFAKTRKFGKDIYHDWVSVALKSDLYVESWLNGPGKLPSNCSFNYKVNNIKSINLPVSQVKFHSSTDHSKWAITNPTSGQSNYWICIGDINREEHQKFRGGGTVCTRNKILWNHYYKIVNEIEFCQKYSKYI